MVKHEKLSRPKWGCGEAVCFEEDGRCDCTECTLTIRTELAAWARELSMCQVEPSASVIQNDKTKSAKNQIGKRQPAMRKGTIKDVNGLPTRVAVTVAPNATPDEPLARASPLPKASDSDDAPFTCSLCQGQVQEDNIGKWYYIDPRTSTTKIACDSCHHHTNVRSTPLRPPAAEGNVLGPAKLEK